MTQLADRPSSVAEPGGEPSDVVQVVTFNIQHGRPATPARGLGPRWRQGTTLLCGHCAGLSADVLALQEVDVRTCRAGWADQAASVGRATGMDHVFGRARRMGALGRYGNALLARGHLEDVDWLPLPSSDAGDGGEPRGAILATASFAGLRLSVAATHLSTDRAQSPVQLEAVLEGLTSRPLPRVLLGDLNLGAEVVGPLVHAAGLSLADVSGPTYPADDPRSRIDHVAVAGLEVAAVEVLPAAPVSDHRPLRARLRRA